jgi:hypothetical protein
MKHLCSDCENDIEVFEKDEVIIVYACEYCKQEAVKLARMCNEKIQTMTINRRVQLPDLKLFVEGIGRAAKAAREGR